jgi:hypothetical protein
MRYVNKIVRWLTGLAIFLTGSVLDSTCHLRAPGLHIDLEDDDEMYVNFPGGYVNFGPGGPYIDVPPFELEIEDD